MKTATVLPRTPTLEEITQQWLAVDRAIEAAEGEITPQMAAELEVLQLTSREKVDGYVWRIRDLESRIARDERIAKEASARCARWKRQIEDLKTRVGMAMSERGVEELPGEIYHFAWEGNGGLVPVLLDVQPSSPLFPDRFLKSVPPPPPVEADTAGLRTALKADDPAALAVAHLAPGRHVAIR